MGFVFKSLEFSYPNNKEKKIVTQMLLIFFSLARIKKININL